MIRTGNPFHIEAVATYGEVVRTCDKLEYMRQASAELNQYLVAYAASDKRYGAAIGFQGGHGSGKTHLLMWLGETAMAVKVVRPIVLYAKADRASIFDLYLQLFLDLPRETLLGILDEALRAVAKYDVQIAKVTESLSSRIEAADTLESLQQEENIDLEGLYRELQTLLDNPNANRSDDSLKVDADENVTKADTELPPKERIPREIPRALTELPDPEYGDRVYQWLSGKAVAGLEDLKLDHSLLQLQVDATESSGPDATAVNVLETIAALLRLAGRPLVVLIDQLEILLRSDPRKGVMSSVLKKLIEQLNRQNAIIFIAGNDESWKMLPPDVPPRLRRRQPIRVGNLSTDETRSLVESYMPDGSRLSDEAVQSIHSLSGGNPREIIRIAYYAYEKTEGAIEDAPPEKFVESANESGSVAERTRRALEIADEVLTKAGSLVRDLTAGDGILIDRVLRTQDKPRLVLIAVKATDRLSEIDSARRVHGVREYIENTWQGIPLIVVTVGYSSDEVRTVLGTTATCMQFKEIDFASELKTKVAEILALQASVEPAHGDAGANLAVLEALKTIASRLDQFEDQRTEEVSSVAERFATKTEALYAPAEKERELRTRWDLLDALDEVQKAVNNQDIEREKELMKSLLVANEVDLKLKQVDYVGGIYLDVLSEEINLYYYGAPAMPAGSPPMPDSSFLEPRTLRKYRLDIIRELRRLFRSRGLIDRWLEAPIFWSLIAGAGLLVIEFPLIYLYHRYSYQLDHRYVLFKSDPLFMSEIWDFSLHYSIPTALATVLFVPACALAVKWIRTQKWERMRKMLSARG